MRLRVPGEGSVGKIVEAFTDPTTPLAEAKPRSSASTLPSEGNQLFANITK